MKHWICNDCGKEAATLDQIPEGWAKVEGFEPLTDGAVLFCTMLLCARCN